MTDILKTLRFFRLLLPEQNEDKVAFDYVYPHAVDTLH